jgi:hypothetical protein
LLHTLIGLTLESCDSSTSIKQDHVHELHERYCKPIFASLIIWLLKISFDMGKSEEECGVETPVNEASIHEASAKEIGDEARRATDIEHRMTVTEGFKIYPKAIGWSMFFSLGVIMTGFDPQLLGSLYAEPAFQRDFGYLYQGSYIISAPWQTALGMGNPIGQVLGALGAGYPMEWYGRKKVRRIASNLEYNGQANKLGKDICSLCCWYSSIHL